MRFSPSELSMTCRSSAYNCNCEDDCVCAQDNLSMLLPTFASSTVNDVCQWRNGDKWRNYDDKGELREYNIREEVNVSLARVRAQNKVELTLRTLAASWTWQSTSSRGKPFTLMAFFLASNGSWARGNGKRKMYGKSLQVIWGSINRLTINSTIDYTRYTSGPSLRKDLILSLSVSIFRNKLSLFDGLSCERYEERLFE